MPTLAEIQQSMAAALLQADQLEPDLFSGDTALSIQRFGFYRGNVNVSWEKSLAGAFPVLKQLVGDEFFAAMAARYGRQLPSSSGDLADFGCNFPGFAAVFEPLATLPYAADLSQLEWAVFTAAQSADSSPLAPALLATLDEESLGALQLSLRPGTALLDSDWNIEGIWRAHQPERPEEAVDISGPSRCIVMRPQWRVEVEALSLGDFTFLTCLQQSTILGDALEQASASDEEFDAQASLVKWLLAGVFQAEP